MSSPFKKSEQEMTRRPTHPGEVLFEDVIKPCGLTITEAAKALQISRKQLSELVNCRCELSTDMAIKIGQWTQTSPESWIVMQVKRNLWDASRRVQVNIQALAACAH
jgi:antitoxin HigA-1